MMLNLSPILSIAFYIGLVTILCVSFTFTYMIEGFPNFAQTSYTLIGSTASYYFARYWFVPRYGGWVLSLIFGGLVGVFYYLVIVKPIKRHSKNQEITLTLTFLVISTVIPYLMHIFNWWAFYESTFSTQGEMLLYQDFYVGTIPGVFLMGVGAAVLIILGLNYFIRHTKLGISLRATSENEELSSVLGINVERVHVIAWFISGGLSTLVGSIGLYDYEGLIISVMSGSILGGLTSIPGAIIGGIFIAFGESILKEIVYIVFGVNMDMWQGILPIIFLVTILFLLPERLFGELQQRKNPDVTY